jgi:hypothetical protein
MITTVYTTLPVRCNIVFSLNTVYLLKCAKRIRQKLSKLMKSSPTYNKLQHYYADECFLLYYV